MGYYYTMAKRDYPVLIACIGLSQMWYSYTGEDTFAVRELEIANQLGLKESDVLESLKRLADESLIELISPKTKDMTSIYKITPNAV